MNTARRTKFSRWVYRISFAIMIFTSIRLARFGWAMANLQTPEAEEYIQLITWVAAMKLPIELFVATIAFGLRSAASYWIVDLITLETSLSFLLPMLSGNLVGTDAIFTIAIFAVIWLLFAAAFIYLIKHEEVRAI